VIIINLFIAVPGRPVAGNSELGAQLVGCVLRVLCGALYVRVADEATVDASIEMTDERAR